MLPITRLIPSDWREALEECGALPHIETLLHKIEMLRGEGKVIYPSEELIFHSLWMTPLSEVRCIIIGQDPYINPQQAMGLAFAVPRGSVIPPSLRNIFTELQREYGGERRTNGDLHDWAAQGVLLLNAILTVEAGHSAAHASLGWQCITRKLVSLALRTSQPQVVFLWGQYARKLVEGVEELSTPQKLVLTAAHPVAATRCNSFAGCGHFLLANKWFLKQGLPAIQWSEQES